MRPTTAAGSENLWKAITLSGMVDSGYRRHGCSFLYRALCSQICIECADTARLLFLLRLSRCCHSCLKESPKFAMARSPDARHFRNQLDRIRKSGMLVLHSIPGPYTSIVGAPHLNRTGREAYGYIWRPLSVAVIAITQLVSVLVNSDPLAQSRSLSTQQALL